MIRWGLPLAVVTAFVLAALGASLFRPAADASITSTLLYGARTMLIVGGAGVSLALMAGSALGVLAGLSGGAWDRLLARTIELISALPTILVVALSRAFVPDPSFATLMLALAFVRLGSVSRLVRAETLAFRVSEQHVGARAIGATRWHIFWHHVWPALRWPLLESAISGFALLVVLEAAMTFLGIGVEPWRSSWGRMLAEGIANSDRARIVLPIVALGTLVLALQQLADQLRARHGTVAPEKTPCDRRD